jgi:hypothetical protein
MLPETVRVMLRVVDAFDRLSIPYLVGGSMASALYGVSRSTVDADLVAEINPDKVDALVASLNEEFYADAEMIRNAIDHHSSFNLIHLSTGFKVDIFIQKDRPFDRLQLQRRILHVLSQEPERKAFISTAEDIILAKLEWYRMGGETSDRQWRDILGVIRVQSGRLDLEYLQRWAAELGVADLLQEALKEAD